MRFDDDDNEGSDVEQQDYEAGPSTRARPNGPSDDDYSDYSDEDDSDDDAPEAVGVAEAKQGVQSAEAERARYVLLIMIKSPCVERIMS